MADDAQTIRALVSRYHQAITDRNAEVEHACFAGNRFRFAETVGREVIEVQAHLIPLMVFSLGQELIT